MPIGIPIDPTATSMDSRLPCVVDPRRPDNCTPILACDAPAVLACNARGCTCDVPAPTLPTIACSFTVSYPADNPGAVLVTPMPDACAASLELAVAALLARLLAP